MAQPPLSRQIKALEDEMGAPLFLRTPAGVELTEAGQTLLDEVPNLLHLSQGCPFSNRCEYATDQCRTEKAQLHPVAPDHQVRCFRCEEQHQ